MNGGVKVHARIRAAGTEFGVQGGAGHRHRAGLELEPAQLAVPLVHAGPLGLRGRRLGPRAAEVVFHDGAADAQGEQGAADIGCRGHTRGG